jgi:hypothetical protein
MSTRNLIVGGIEIPVYALIDAFAQDYEEIAAIAGLRMSDGSLIIQRAWPASGNYKLRTTISGGGSLPAPLDGLDRGSAHEISCAESRAIGSASNIITLPTGRRSDTGHTPQGYALVSGELVSTPLTIGGNVATLTTVAGAQHYQVRYWPKFSGMITHRSSGNPWQAAKRWTLVVEEV